MSLYHFYGTFDEVKRAGNEVNRTTAQYHFYGTPVSAQTKIKTSAENEYGPDTSNVLDSETKGIKRTAATIRRGCTYGKSPT